MERKKAAILRIKNEKENKWYEIPAIKGDSGVGIEKVENVDGKLKITLTDGRSTEFEIGTGSGGTGTGADGKDGLDGSKITNITSNEDSSITITVETPLEDGSVETKEYTTISLKGDKGDQGISITKTEINDNGELVITYSDNKTETLGRVVGTDGDTPYIGENGNWYIDDTDTEVRAEGNSGVYVGTGEMPDNCNVQIDPSGEETITLPNPYALTFTGAATGSYDGSTPLTINIPDGNKITDIQSNADGSLTFVVEEFTEDGLVYVTEYKTKPLKGADGNDGAGIESIVVNDDYSLTITTEEVRNGNVIVTPKVVYTTPSLKGEQGIQGTPGENGADGADGKTPYIKDRNWWIGEIDTGVKAQGANGESVTVASVQTSVLPGGKNIVTFSDGKTLTVRNGEQGLQGEQGESGVYVGSGTPPTGTKVQVNPDGESIEILTAEETRSIITEMLADKTQLTPEYADSLEELEASGDTSKLYVLPDGYIYAYMGVYAEGGTVPNFTNQIPISKDADGNIYNGTGFKDGIKFSSSNGAETAQAGYVATGYIPIGYGSAKDATGEQVIRLSGVKMAGGDNNARVALYYADKTFIGTATASNMATAPKNGGAYYTVGDDGFVDMIDVTGLTAMYNIDLGRTTALFRLCAPGIDTNSILTVNEPIEYTTTEGGLVYSWQNTGRAFVPADYEDRILHLETGLAVAEANIESLKKTSSSGSNTSGEAVPEAVATGASNLVTKALSREYTGDNILRFVVFSDTHQRNFDTLVTSSTKELGMAIGEIVNQMNVDFIANLGDSAWAGYGDTKETVREQLKQFNKLTKPYFKGELELKCEGNHDDSVYSIIDNDGDGTTASISKFVPQEIHALVHSKCEDVVYDGEHFIDGYFYKDFEHLKTRVVCLHTEQGTGDGAVMEGYQLKWFAETALNMSGKADWNVVTMAHRPPTYGNASLCYDATSIIEAFINKTNFSHTTNDGTQIAIDYTDKSCQYVAHFHGHTHAFSVVKMLKRKNGMANVEINAWEIGIPNACYYRSNGNKGNANEIIARYSTETTYDKADVDGQRTSFNLVTVCLDEKKIYADNYGAGIDRVISY